METGGNEMENNKRKVRKIEQVIGKIDKIIETHISIIYMGDKGLVAKEIKAVDLGFVDLRPIKKRRESIKKTAQVDRIYCPDLNSVATEIYGIPMIIMRKFDPESTLDKLYEQGKINLEMAEQIGRLFDRAHRKSKTNIRISEKGNKAISDNWEDSFRDVREKALAVGRSISSEDYEKITKAVRDFILKNKEYLTMRKDNGFIRQVHGDGHAGNMFFENGVVKLFDSIGFKDEFSCIDLVADVAFSIMDAIAHDRVDIADVIKKTYIEKSGDIEGVNKLLNFWICHRAYVRGQCSTMASNGMTGESQEEMLAVGSKYFDLAVRYLPT